MCVCAFDCCSARRNVAVIKIYIFAFVSRAQRAEWIFASFVHHVQHRQRRCLLPLPTYILLMFYIYCIWNDEHIGKASATCVYGRVFVCVHSFLMDPNRIIKTHSRTTDPFKKPYTTLDMEWMPWTHSHVTFSIASIWILSNAIKRDTKLPTYDGVA